jgi:outer membrane lipoprotein SlyB
MKKIMTLAIVVSLLFPSGALLAQDRQGVQLEITKTDGTKINGELIAVKQDSTLLLESSLLEPSSGSGGSIDVSEVKIIKIVKGSNAGAGLLLGLLAGGAVGTAIGNASYSGKFLGGIGVVASGIIGGLAGGLVGGMIGSSIHNDETFRIEGKSQEQIKAVLEKLRTQARFPKYR